MPEGVLVADGSTASGRPSNAFYGAVFLAPPAIGTGSRSGSGLRIGVLSSYAIPRTASSSPSVFLMLRPGATGPTEGCRHDDRLAPARPLRRRSHAPPCRGRRGVHGHGAQAARRRADAAALEDHPWRDRAVAQEEASAKGQRLPGATSRWNRGKDLSWEPLRPE